MLTSFPTLCFRHLDPTSSGRIPHDAFLNAMCTSNDREKIQRDFVLALLNDVKYQVHVGTSDKITNANPQQPMFNYEKYCHDVIDTSEKLLKKVTQITIETEQSFAVNSKTYKVGQLHFYYNLKEISRENILNPRLMTNEIIFVILSRYVVVANRLNITYRMMLEDDQQHQSTNLLGSPRLAQRGRSTLKENF